MTLYIEKPAQNIRAELMALRAARRPDRQQPFWFTGNGTLTTFTLGRGWKPGAIVSKAGALQREGSGNDYTVAFDGFNYSVTFAVAPANLAAICVIGVAA